MPLVHAAVLLVSAPLLAQSLASPGPHAGLGPADWDRPPPRVVDSRIPTAARGFQAAVRLGAQLPWGSVSDAQGDDLSARYGFQVPVLIDVGFKLQKPWFLGGYGGIGFGRVGSGSEAEQACSASGVDCSTLSYQLGVQAQYHFGPSDQLNPWLGLGAGYETFRQSLSANGYSEEQETSGIALLKLGLGLDYRSSFGLGPFAELSVGRFQGTRTVVDGKEAHAGPVEPGAWHGFITLGARLVVLP